MHVVRVEPCAHRRQVEEEEGRPRAIRDAPLVDEALGREEMGGGQDHHQRPGATPASRRHRRPGDDHDHGQVGRSEESDRSRRGAQRKRKREEGEPRRGQQEPRARGPLFGGIAAGAADGEDEGEAIGDHDRGGADAGGLEDVLGVVRDEGHVRAQKSADRLVQPRQGAREVGAEAGAAAGDAHHLEGLGIGERAAPPRRAGHEQRGHRRPQREAAAGGAAPEPPRRRRDRAGRHQVRPQGEAGERAPGHESGRARRARGQGRAQAQGQPEHGRGEQERRRVHGRRQRGQQQEVRRRAGHQDGRGQGGPGIEGARQRVRRGNQGEAEEEIHERRVAVSGRSSAKRGAAIHASSGEP
jgi:hypothetical protein